MNLRLTAARRILLLAMALLACRCAQISLINGPGLTALAVAQRSLDIPLPQGRGAILDRNGTPLALASQPPLPGPPFTHVALYPGMIQGEQEDLAALEGMVPGALWGQARVAKLSDDDANVIASIARRTVGVVPFRMASRYSGLAIHVLGHTTGGSTGADGLEASFNWALSMPSAPAVRVQVDANAKCISGLNATAVKSGSAGWVRTTIDSNLQAEVEHVLSERARGEAGAVVVLHAHTGQVLALASWPGYDPDDVVTSVRRADGAMINRAVIRYYPGSVFKVVVAAAALESGISESAWSYHDDGSFDAGGNTFRCHSQSSGGHGDVTISDVVAYSCNTGAIALAQQVGAEALRAQAAAFGIGDSSFQSHLHLPSAATGRLAPPRETASLPGLANLALGQAHVEMTPVEAGAIMACIASGGRSIRPSLVLEAQSSSGKHMMYPTSIWGESVVSPKTAASLRKMLGEVVDRGTAVGALAGCDCAGKTGTAQTGRVDPTGAALYNAWFVGYAPRDNPEIVVSVVVETGRSGADAAAPVFGDIISYWTRTSARTPS